MVLGNSGFMVSLDLCIYQCLLSVPLDLRIPSVPGVAKVPGGTRRSGDATNNNLVFESYGTLVAVSAQCLCAIGTFQ